MMRLVRCLLFIAPGVALLAAFLAPQPGQALPLFARKYQFVCTQCHVAFPRLNAFGMAFRQNGYRLKGEEAKAPWEEKEFPLSLIGNVGATINSTVQADSSGARGRFTSSEFTQNAVEFHSAGTLANNVSFHFDNGFTGVQGDLQSGMAFVQLDDVVKDGALNLKAGVYDAEIPYLSNARAMTQATYLSPVTLDGRGLELNGNRSQWTYALGLINSERTTGKAGSKSLNNLENVYAWLMRDVRGQLVTGRVFLDRQDPRKPNQTSSQHVQAMVSAYFNSGRWLLIPGYVYEGFADEPDTTGVGTGTLAVQGGLIEGTVVLDPASRWVVTSRYEIRHVAKSRVSAKGDDALFALNLGYYVSPNAKIAIDWTHLSTRMRNLVEDNPLEPVMDQIQLYAHVGY